MDFPKVELHLHADGAPRHETLFELAKQKGIDLGVKSVEELKEVTITGDAKDLDKVLRAFHIFMPAIIGDPDAVERIAFELCEDQANQGVIYFEGRYCPQFMANTEQSATMQVHTFRGKGDVTPDMITQSVIRGFERGEKAFGVKARSILCCIRAHPHWSPDTLDLCVKYKDKGVVGLDIAGCAHGGSDEKYEDENIHVFQEAKRLGIPRTVHAGESGDAKNVENALDQLSAQRIGHGYHALDDPKVYERMLREQIHFEACPVSSWATGAVTVPWDQHPVKRFAKDGANFGLSTDDPTCFGHYLDEELRLAHDRIGLTYTQIWQAQLNAAKSCFLPDSEKAEIVQKIMKAKPKRDD